MPSSTGQIPINLRAVLVSLERLGSECFDFGCYAVWSVAALRVCVCMVISAGVGQVTHEVPVHRPRKSMNQYEVPP